MLVVLRAVRKWAVGVVSPTLVVAIVVVVVHNSCEAVGRVDSCVAIGTTTGCHERTQGHAA